MPMSQDTYSMSELVRLVRAQEGETDPAEALQAKENEAPYASLVHILRAMREDTPENRFKAAIYSPERGMLKALIMPDLTSPEPAAKEMEKPLRDAPIVAHLVQTLPRESPESEPVVEEQADAPEAVTDEAPMNMSPSHPANPAPPQTAEEQTEKPHPTRTVTHWRIAPLCIYEPVNTRIPAQSLDLFSIQPEDQAERKGSQAFQDYLQEQIDIYGQMPEKTSQSLHPVVKQQELVQKFLATPPASMRRPVLQSENRLSKQVDDQAEQSIENDHNLITETLAHLHLKQNHPEEAIRIYQELCLRYPEKKAYFTGQIEKIKEQNI